MRAAGFEGVCLNPDGWAPQIPHKAAGELHTYLQDCALSPVPFAEGVVIQGGASPMLQAAQYAGEGHQIWCGSACQGRDDGELWDGCTTQDIAWLCNIHLPNHGPASQHNQPVLARVLMMHGS